MMIQIKPDLSAYARARPPRTDGCVRDRCASDVDHTHTYYACLNMTVRAAASVGAVGVVGGSTAICPEIYEHKSVTKEL